MYGLLAHEFAVSMKQSAIDVALGQLTEVTTGLGILDMWYVETAQESTYMEIWIRIIKCTNNYRSDDKHEDILLVNLWSVLIIKDKGPRPT